MIRKTISIIKIGLASAARAIEALFFTADGEGFYTSDDEVFNAKEE